MTCLGHSTASYSAEDYDVWHRLGSNTLFVRGELPQIWGPTETQPLENLCKEHLGKGNRGASWHAEQLVVEKSAVPAVRGRDARR